MGQNWGCGVAKNDPFGSFLAPFWAPFRAPKIEGFARVRHIWRTKPGKTRSRGSQMGSKIGPILRPKNGRFWPQNRPFGLDMTLSVLNLAQFDTPGPQNCSKMDQK